MNAEEFVTLWKTEKDNLLSLYIESEESQVSHLIKSMNLSGENMDTMKDIVNTILTDSFYSLLLGLDGCSQIGGIQQEYKIHDESGKLISSRGELEEFAWEQFHCED